MLFRSARDQHSGAALLDHAGQLIGIGSLWVGDATDSGAAFPGNMFVPTNLLTPILDDLKAHGRRRGVTRPAPRSNRATLYSHSKSTPH